MAVHVRKHHAKHNGRTHHYSRSSMQKLPRGVAKQLETIYFQSVKSLKRKPYKAVASTIITSGVVAGVYFLVRYLRAK